MFSSSSELSAREDSSHSLMSFLMVPCCWSRYMRDTSCTIVMFQRCCKTGQGEGGWQDRERGKSQGGHSRQ